MTSELSLLCSSGNIGCRYSPTFPDTLRYNRKGVISQNETNKHLSNVQAVKTLDNFPSQENNLPCTVPYLYHHQTSTEAPEQETAGQQITFQKYFPSLGKIHREQLLWLTSPDLKHRDLTLHSQHRPLQVLTTETGDHIQAHKCASVLGRAGQPDQQEETAQSFLVHFGKYKKSWRSEGTTKERPSTTVFWTSTVLTRMRIFWNKSGVLSASGPRSSCLERW